MRVGTRTVLSGNLARVRKSARYQLTMPVSEPGCDQADRYWARSSGVKVRGRLERRRARTPTRKLKAQKRASGSQGSCKKNMYQLRRRWRGFVLRNFRITEGSRTLRTASLARRCECTRAALKKKARPHSGPA